MGFNTIAIPPYLVNEHYDDRYFDVVDAIVEAQHIYINGCGVLETIHAQTDAQKHYRIGETGFGAGRTLIALIDVLEHAQIQNLSLVFNSVELHPIQAERMAQILAPFKQQVGAESIDQLVAHYAQIDIDQLGWQQLELQRSFGTVTLNLWIGEALEMVQALQEPCDAWFLDGHGPKKNPEMWRSELLKAVGEKTHIGGTCATFTVAVAVRKDLTEAGFEMVKAPGLGRKNHVSKGIKTEDR